jgi:osmotically-inducible protein OsmY
MSTRRHRPDRSTSGSQIASALAGGMAGVAVGLVVAQAFGGLAGIAARFREVVDDAGGLEPGFDGAVDESEDELVDDLDDDGTDEALGERVLEAFRNDPTLAERAIDIEAGFDGTIELTGQVDADREIDYATTIAGGVPGVRHVVTRLGVKGRGWMPVPR